MSDTNNAFVSELEAHGYFKGLPSADARALKQEFREQGWMAIFSDSHRLFMTDAEDLAEGGIGAFIQEIEPFLEKQKVRVPEISDDFNEEGYTVRVGEEGHKIYDHGEMEREAAEKQHGLVWGLAATRGFEIVDELLEGAGSHERLYAINGGNDLTALFLTPELHKIISGHPDADAKNGPYKMTEDYPAFGQPQE